MHLMVTAWILDDPLVDILPHLVKELLDGAANFHQVIGTVRLRVDKVLKYVE